MKALLVLLFISVSQYTQHATQWKQVKNEKGINVYTTNREGYEVKGVKVETTFNCGVQAIVNAIMDVRSYPNWVYACSETRLLKTISNDELIYYHVTNAPWPVNDRDLVSLFELKKFKDGTVTIQSRSINNFFEERSGYVRVKSSSARWVFTPDQNGKTHAYYELFFNPGGNIPAWMVNLFITEGPYQSMLKLKKRIEP